MSFPISPVNGQYHRTSGGKVFQYVSATNYWKEIKNVKDEIYSYIDYDLREKSISSPNALQRNFNNNIKSSGEDGLAIRYIQTGNFNNSFVATTSPYQSFTMTASIAASGGIPIGNSIVCVYVNSTLVAHWYKGVDQEVGMTWGTDISVSGTTLTFAAGRNPGDSIVVNYFPAGTIQEDVGITSYIDFNNLYASEAINREEIIIGPRSNFMLSSGATNDAVTLFGWDKGYQVSSHFIVADVLGTVDMSGGYDFSSTNFTFVINVDKAGPTIITLNTNTTDLTSVIKEINDSLTTSSLNSYIEAYAEYPYVGLRMKYPIAKNGIKLITSADDFIVKKIDGTTIATLTGLATAGRQSLALSAKYVAVPIVPSVGNYNITWGINGTDACTSANSFIASTEMIYNQALFFNKNSDYPWDYQEINSVATKSSYLAPYEIEGLSSLYNSINIDKTKFSDGGLVGAEKTLTLNDTISETIKAEYLNKSIKLVSLSENLLVLDSWRLMGLISAGKYGLAGCGTQNSAMIVGGVISGPSVTNVTEKFNGISWATSGNIGTATCYLASAGLSGAALAFDGSTTVAGTVTNSIYSFDGVTWGYFGASGASRFHLGSCGKRNAALNFGGNVGTVAAPTANNISERFFGTGTVATVGSLVAARYGQAGAGSFNSALSIGGTPAGATGTTEKFNSVAGGGFLTWGTLTAWSLINSSYFISSAGTQSAALASGGTAGGGNAEKFNGNAWTATTNANVPRQQQAAMGTQNAALFVGGWNGTSTYYAMTEKFVGQIKHGFEIQGIGQNDKYTVFDFDDGANLSITDDNVYVTYGISQNLNYGLSDLEKNDIAEIEKLDVGENIWQLTSSLNIAREGLGGCGTQGAALAISGSGTNVTEKFNGSNWSTSPGWDALYSSPYHAGNTGSQNSAFTFGGYVSSAPSALTAKFNGSTWRIAEYLLVAQYCLAGSGVQNAALAIGGTTNNTNYIATTEKFNGNAWSYTVSLNVTRGLVGGAGSQNAAIVSGGSSGTTGSPTIQSTAEKFNGVTWSNTGSLSAARYFTANSGTQNSALCFASHNGTVAVTITEKFNGNIWFNSSNINMAIYSHAGSGTQNATLSFGGYTGAIAVANTEKFSRITLYNSVWIWTTAANMLANRKQMAGCGIQSAALSIGGFEGARVATTDKFNGSTWANISGGNLTSGRYESAACGSIYAAVCFAGADASANSNVTEKFNGAVWSTSGNLTARHFLAGCGSQNAALSIGGEDGSGAKTTTEKFDGSTWSAAAFAIGSATTALSASGSINAALEFGGFTGGATTGITQKFNGIVAWVNTGFLNLARFYLSGCGSQNSALNMGGTTDGAGYSARSDIFNSLVWISTNSLNNGRWYAGAAGTQSLGLVFGGQVSGGANTNITEKFALDNSNIYTNLINVTKK
jgi:hypothetical protein